MIAGGRGRPDAGPVRRAGCSRSGGGRRPRRGWGRVLL